MTSYPENTQSAWIKLMVLFAYLPVNVGVIIGPAIGSLITRNSVFNVFPTAALLTALSVILLGIAKRLPVKSG